MNELKVESTTLRALGYDDGRGILHLEFRSLSLCHYYDVPAAVYQGLLGAPSKGGYFNRINWGLFPYALCASARAGLEGKA